jgi:hypothetical protein
MKPPKKQGPTAEERELERVSIAEWNDYVGRYRPAEAALIKDAQLTAGERASVKGQASADTAAAFKDLTSQTIRTGGQTGAKLSSGRTKFGLAGDALASGKARGLSAAAAETGAEFDRDQKELGITATGRNIAHDVTANLSRGAQRATRLSLAASQARFDRNAATVNALSSVAGAVTRKFGDPFGEKSSREQLELIDTTSFPKRRPFSHSQRDFLDLQGEF